MPRKQTSLILSRDMGRPVEALETPVGFRLEHIQNAQQAGFAELDQFCCAHGFPGGWAQAILGAGAEAFVVIASPIAAAAAPPAVVAAGWLTRRAFFIDEIGYTFTPEPRGDYFFGDFVEPAWRGRRLQRLLIHRRLQASAAAGRAWAFSMMRRENAASLRSYEAEGFQPAARLSSRSIRRWRLDRLRPLRRDLPQGKLAGPGVPLPFSLRLGRTK